MYVRSNKELAFLANTYPCVFKILNKFIRVKDATPAREAASVIEPPCDTETGHNEKQGMGRGGALG